MSEATELHRRTIDYDVERPESGRTSARGELVDHRRIGMGRHLGKTHPPGVVHHMGLAVETDPTGLVERSDAWMKTAPFEESPKTGGEACRHILPHYERLVGKRFDDRYAASVIEDVGGPNGCFHVLSLVQCLPFAVLAASGRTFHRAIDVRAQSGGGTDSFVLEGTIVDSDETGRSETSRLRLVLEFPGFRIAAAEGEGSEADAAGRLEGLTIARGFTGAALERLGGARNQIALVVAMSPVTAQAAGTFAAFLGWDIGARAAARASTPQIGSCHMWRSDGPLVRLTAEQAAKGGTA